MRHWGTREWGAAAIGSALALLLLGVPAVLIPNQIFAREIEPTWWSYPVWIATAILSGLLLATYTRPNPDSSNSPGNRRSIGGGLLAWFAIGCPVCNKIVLLALGTSGAMTWFAPLQPLLAVVGLALLIVALRSRLRTSSACPTPSTVSWPQRT